jgi:ElaB/YqjD/DUF883 family membrane-anchored ribosome-binding protein
MSQATPSSTFGSMSTGNSGALSSGSPSSGSTAQMQEKVQDIKQNLQDLGSGARQMANEQLQNLRTAASDQLQNVRSTASDYFEQGRSKAMDMERTLESQIRDQPLRAVLIAAGIGLVFGVLWNRR